MFLCWNTLVKITPPYARGILKSQTWLQRLMNKWSQNRGASWILWSREIKGSNHLFTSNVNFIIFPAVKQSFFPSKMSQNTQNSLRGKTLGIYRFYGLHCNFSIAKNMLRFLDSIPVFLVDLVQRVWDNFLLQLFLVVEQDTRCWVGSLRWVISFYSPTQLCGGGTTKSEF